MKRNVRTLQLLLALAAWLVFTCCGGSTNQSATASSEGSDGEAGDLVSNTSSETGDCNLGEPPLHRGVWIEHSLGHLSRLDPLTGGVIASTECIDFAGQISLIGLGSETMWVDSREGGEGKPTSIYAIDRAGSVVEAFQVEGNDGFPTAIVELESQPWLVVWMDDDGDGFGDRTEMRRFDPQTFEFSDVVDLGSSRSLYATDSALVVYELGNSLETSLFRVIDRTGQSSTFSSPEGGGFWSWFSTGPDGATWISTASAIQGFGFYRLDLESGLADSYQYVTDYEGRNASGDRSAHEEIVIADEHAFIIDTETPVPRLLKVELATGTVTVMFDLCAECDGSFASVSGSSLILGVKPPDDFRFDFQLVDTETFEVTNLDIEGKTPRTSVDLT